MINILKAVRAGKITIRPKVSEQDFYRWMDDVQDWCISRQLWWGHRAPVYLVKLQDAEPVVRIFYDI